MNHPHADLKIFPYVCFHLKIISWKFHILKYKTSWIYGRKNCIYLKSKLIVNVLHCFFMFLNNLYCGGNKSSTATNLVLISKFFQSFASEGKFISSQSYLPMNGLFFAIISDCFPIFLCFNGTVLTYLKKNYLHQCF